MTEKVKNSTAQSTIQDPPEYNAENATSSKEASDWLGGPQNGSETSGTSTEGAYQQNGQSFIGGPQDVNEIPESSTQDYTKHR